MSKSRSRFGIVASTRFVQFPGGWTGSTTCPKEHTAAVKVLRNDHEIQPPEFYEAPRGISRDEPAWRLKRCENPYPSLKKQAFCSKGRPVWPVAR